MSEEEYAEGLVKTKVTHDLIIDLYEKYKKMEEGELKVAFLETIKVLSKNVGSFLVVPDKDD